MEVRQISELQATYNEYPKPFLKKIKTLPSTFRGPSHYGEKITYSASLTPVLRRYDLPFLSLSKGATCKRTVLFVRAT